MPCPCATRVKRNYRNHTLQCEKPEGHDGMHEVRDDDTRRLVVWTGTATTEDLPGNTRFRFGLNRD